MAWRETVVISRNFDARGNPPLRPRGLARATFARLAPAPVIIPVRKSRVPERPRIKMSLVHQHVAELPGIAGVEGFRKQLAAVDERRPVGVAPDHWTEIRPLQVEATTEIHFIGLDDAALGILQHPHHAV